MTFANAIKTQTTTTTNGMIAFKQSKNACVDLFYRIGASRGQNIISTFIAAYVENPNLALRITAWSRDIRQGAGERELFHQILRYLEKHQPQDAVKLMKMIPELGRFDDLLVFKDKQTQLQAIAIIQKALSESNELAAKWMPRKGPMANLLCRTMNLSPQEYRKTLVSLTHVVETKMCNNDWDTIDFGSVPSLAHARYKRAFHKHSITYTEYAKKLSIKEPGVKINAGAVYPYNVLQGTINPFHTLSKTELDVIEAQWNAMPDFVGSTSILPLVDVSGSMLAYVGENHNLTFLEIAVGLGLYFADKNKGSFKDSFLTFSGEPQLLHLQGTITQKIDQMCTSSWAMNTNLNKALNLILKTALEGQVKNEDMPKILLILSDMQFDSCITFTSFEMIKAQYESAGYELPAIVFWNLDNYANVPVNFNQQGVALVSGFSPIIAEAIINADFSNLTPESIMMAKIMNDRYDPEKYL